jgi:hypothetical protein
VSQLKSSPSTKAMEREKRGEKIYVIQKKARQNKQQFLITD